MTEPIDFYREPPEPETVEEVIRDVLGVAMGDDPLDSEVQLAIDGIRARGYELVRLTEADR